MSRHWNTAYENDDTPWDKGVAAPPLKEFLEKRNIEGRILVPGCGAGHDVRLLAEQGAEVVGLDIAPAAVKRADGFPAVANESYAVGNFLDLEDRYHGAFDVVFEHTCLCAIDPEQREAYTIGLKQALKPGGSYLAVFFREVPDYDGDGPPHPISAEEIKDRFGTDFEVIDSFIPQQTYESRPVGCEEVVLMRLR